MLPHIVHSLVLQAHKRKRIRQRRTEDHAKYKELPTRPHAHFVFGQPAMKLSMHPGTYTCSQAANLVVCKLRSHPDTFAMNADKSPVI